MTTTRLYVPAVSCDTCRRAIETAVAPLAGVATVDVDLATGTVTVHYDERVTAERLIELIEAQGYDVVSHRSEETPVRGETS
ncbi:heavy-metal-associated domain-containing protein [Mycobacterium sp.]|uniref:heavy-metal-associated domain-containing protein n=1 Tax=Mycobacterium sp. TaxID=1785 RepID=UPI001284F00C|nr:heavy-metal-associated domain-containing protein [Mycobacterium sp.]KAA8962458.1 MAG: heavy-metal-associated domain-containing protein [Mycobacterium sp.]